MCSYSTSVEIQVLNLEGWNAKDILTLFFGFWWLVSLCCSATLLTRSKLPSWLIGPTHLIALWLTALRLPVVSTSGEWYLVACWEGRGMSLLKKQAQSVTAWGQVLWCWQVLWGSSGERRERVYSPESGDGTCEALLAREDHQECGAQKVRPAPSWSPKRFP